MIARLLATIFGTQNERELKQLWPLVESINSFEPAIKALDDEHLKAKTNEFRKQLSDGKTLDELLPEAFAVVREVARRTLGQRHYDVQLIGGIVLHQGKIAEMRTGEGKTLTATLPLYLNALTGKGVHLVTVNDYLARRDSAWMAPIFEYLGLTVGVLQNSMDDSERKTVYGCDIIYATNNELGFDYLRDNMKFRLDDYVQREPYYAIVDEIDSILIDEARTPLIISGAADNSSILYKQTNSIVELLLRTVDYEIDEKEKYATLTEGGVDKIESAFQVRNLYAVDNIKILHHTTQALKAHALFKRDVDYVVVDNQVMIVDEFTGRILPGRRYSDGLHQALEAKEGVEVQQESQTLASITLQNYFRLYQKLAGMTGTAVTEAEEFHKIYKLDVISIPTNTTVIRQDKDDLIYLGQEGKIKAIVQDVKERHKKGQPVLIGTIAIEKSEILSKALHAHNIPHSVLNAKQHEREAEIIEHAGEPGRVTIATNMAGRGTDIKLTEESKRAGGLYILGTERHESRRIDNQLRGRAGRQGDPGESRFYISLDDDLIRIFAGDTIKNRMKMFGMNDDEVIEDRMISKVIESSQEKVEKHNFDIRKHLLEYDDVLNQQRNVIYTYRRNILEGSNEIFDLIRDIITDTINDVITVYTKHERLDHSIYHAIITTVSNMTGIVLVEMHAKQFNNMNSEDLRRDLIQFVIMQYNLYIKDDSPEYAAAMKDAQKWVMLEIIDQSWKNHMLNLDSLKEGINLRSWGQKNPLIEYKREAFVIFEEMIRSIRTDIISHIFRINLEQFDRIALETKRLKELMSMHMTAAEKEQAAEDERIKNSPAERKKRKKKPTK